MYRYQISNYYEKKIPNIALIYLPVNKNGFADILSIDLEYTLKLKKAKNKINEINSSLWEDIKNYTNPYELIYVFNNHHNNTYHSNTCHNNQFGDRNDRNIDNVSSIANIKPLSRSFFKMIEIINEFIPNICDGENIINSLHIAEGPGGFIEATRYTRNRMQMQTGVGVGVGISNDKAFGITLIDDTHKNVPAWKQSNIFLKKHPEVIISTGIDGTGNIYNIENILFLDKQIKEYCSGDAEKGDVGVIDFITADGGFDYSIDYNYQEQASSKLIFSQIITALKCQKLCGDFVCKFFDLNSYLTVEMLYILYLSYDKITIYKPFTSRIANSEKYIICNGYVGIDSKFLDDLFNVLKDWNTKSDTKTNAKTDTHKTLNQLFTEIPVLFIEKIKELNKIIIDNQIQSINNIANIVSVKTYLDKYWKKENLEKNANLAKEWCKKYKIPYNNFYL